MKLRFYLRGLGIGILVTAIILTIAYRGKTTPMTDDEVRERAKELGMEDKYGSGTLADMQAEADKAAEDAIAKDAGKTDDAAAADAGKTDDAATTDAGKKDEAVAVEADKTEESAAADTVTDTGKTNDTAAADTDKTDDTAAADTGKSEDTEAADADKTEDTAAADSQVADTDKTEDTVAADSQVADTDKTEDTAAADTDKKDAAADTDKSDEENPVVGSTDILFVVSSGQGSDTVAVNLKKAGLVKDSAAFDAYLCSKGYDKILRTGKHVIPAGASEEQIAKILTGAGE